ncbi:MAG: extracellular solute-binding protein [Actinomyces ruminicola]|nr:extracellular solute-binding protein [Actinomyces ruminicola]
MTITRRAFGACALTAVAATLAACGSNSMSESDSTGAAGSGDSTGLTLLIGSSGDAETAAYTSAVEAFTAETGVAVELQLATDLQQELAQGFAANAPADVFYLAPDYLAAYAGNGSLYAYGDQLSNVDDFHPALVSSLTYDGVLYGAPKDFSTLALFINTTLWQDAGLTEADYPTDWASLESVAGKLAAGGAAPLTCSPEYARIGAFMAQAGGGLTDADGTKATANSAESVAGLTEVNKLLESGALVFSSELGAGWGGEAFGSGLAVMAIEGNWLTGSLSADYPDVEYVVVELPAGPAGRGTMQFTNGYGIAAASKHQDDAVRLVEFLTSTEQQLAFARAFGVMPSVASARDQWESENPAMTAFIAGADYAISVPTAAGAADVVSDFNSQIATLPGADPQTILDSVQANLEAVIS